MAKTHGPGATSTRKSACLMALSGNQQSAASAVEPSGVPSRSPSLLTLPATRPLSSFIINLAGYLSSVSCFSTSQLSFLAFSLNCLLCLYSFFFTASFSSALFRPLPPIPFFPLLAPASKFSLLLSLLLILVFLLSLN